MLMFFHCPRCGFFASPPAIIATCHYTLGNQFCFDQDLWIWKRLFIFFSEYSFCWGICLDPVPGFTVAELKPPLRRPFGCLAHSFALLLYTQMGPRYLKGPFKFVLVFFFFFTLLFAPKKLLLLELTKYLFIN